MDADAFRDASIGAVVTSRVLTVTWSLFWAAIGSLLIAEVPLFDWA